MHELGRLVLILVAVIGGAVVVLLFVTALMSLFLTPFMVFGWKGNRIGKFRQHLHSCVVEGDCPLGDDAFHRWIEKRVWALDQRFGLIALIPATFVWAWIDFSRMLLQSSYGSGGTTSPEPHE